MLLVLFELMRAVLSDDIITTNYTKVIHVPDDRYDNIIIRFDIIDIKNQQVACYLSQNKLDNFELTIEEIIGQLWNNQNVTYDYQSIRTNSSSQLVQFKVQETMYLRCQAFGDFIKNVQLQIQYNVGDFRSTCINGCGGYDIPSDSSSLCVSNHCHCLDSSLGIFCQLQAHYILSDLQFRLQIKPYQWYYLSYQYGNKSLTIQTQDSDADVSLQFTLVLKTIPQTNIPIAENLRTINGQADITDWIKKLENIYTQSGLNVESQIVYIGFYNPYNYEVKFDFILTEQEQDIYDPQVNKIIIIVTGCVVGALLILSFILSVIRTRQQQQIERERQIYIQQVREQLNQQNQNRVVHIAPKIHSGFTRGFLQSYFKKYNYEQLIQNYKNLAQFEECIVCLETLKETDCGVTPCFHIFHYKCLHEWLGRQKTCPVCRQHLTRKRVQEMYPWVDLMHRVLSEEGNIGKVQSIDIVLHNQLNESQEDLVRKGHIVQDRPIL